MEKGGKEDKENVGGGNLMKQRTNQASQKKLSADLAWNMNLKEKEVGGILIGKLITDRNLNRTVTCQMIRKGWSLEKSDDLEIAEVERNTYSFEFRRNEDYQKILKGRPW